MIYKKRKEKREKRKEKREKRKEKREKTKHSFSTKFANIDL